MKIGLKLFSTDTVLIPDARELHERALYDFIELYCIPNTFAGTIAHWDDIPSPFVIHAPHSYHGINFAQQVLRRSNEEHFADSRRFADKLGADSIIVHGGNNGTLEEALDQIRRLQEPRIVLENKPQKGIAGEICVGWSPEELRFALAKGVVQGTVLDFGHAFYAARTAGIDPMVMTKEFMDLGPRIFHLSDGLTGSVMDVHLNLGHGDFPLAQILTLIPEQGLVTLETPRDPMKRLGDFVADAAFIGKYRAASDDRVIAAPRTRTP